MQSTTIQPKRYQKVKKNNKIQILLETIIMTVGYPEKKDLCRTVNNNTTSPIYYSLGDAINNPSTG